MPETVIKDYTLEDVEKLLTFLRKNYPKLADKADQEAFKNILRSLETAKTMADDRRKLTCLMDAATKYTNQLAFRLYIEENLDDETAKIFREFSTVKEVSGEAQKIADADRARAEEITKLQQEYMAERKPFEIFQAVINGMSEEEAKQKQAEFEARQADGIANATRAGQI